MGVVKKKLSKNSNKSVNSQFFLRDIEVMPEEEADVRLGVVQWGVMSHHGLEHLLRVSHCLFTKVCENINEAQSQVNLALSLSRYECEFSLMTSIHFF